MRRLDIIFAIGLGFVSYSASAGLEESFQGIAEGLCKKTIEAKAPKSKGSKLESVCVLVAKTGMGSCAAETAKIYKSNLGSKEKDKVSKMTKSSLAFCSDYADVSGAEIVNLVLDRSAKEKISVEEATVKTMKEAM